MCFCLLPVTGLNLNFIFPGELVDWRIFGKFCHIFESFIEERGFKQ